MKLLEVEIIKSLTFCKLKFAMGMYSGQKPRFGIWALAQARTESTRIIFPNMSDDDLPRTPIEASTFIYIKQERWPRSYPLCVTHVLALLRYSPWPEMLAEADRGHWSMMRLRISWQIHRRRRPRTRNARSIMQLQNERYFPIGDASPYGNSARVRSTNSVECQWFLRLNTRLTD